MTKRKQPKWLLNEAVLAIHKMLIAEHGGTAEVRDRGLLESALARPKNLHGYENPKPSLARLAASYAFGIAKNHPFVDGNKRVALTASAVFLEINGRTLTASEAEAVVMVEGLAAGSISEEELAAWFEENTERA
ncbi:type II toxin-antitoxin system death-on-curing family toxin [Myxococcota bacterium]